MPAAVYGSTAPSAARPAANDSETLAGQLAVDEPLENESTDRTIRDASTLQQELPPAVQNLDPILTGTVVDEDDRPLSGAEIEVLTPNGDVYATGETATGQWALPLPEGEYDVVVTYGSATSELHVDHSGDDSDVTHELELCSGVPFTTNREHPATGEPITFRSCESGADPSWELDDGTTLDGETVSHTYENEGTYDVTLSVGGATYTRSIEVQNATVAITDVRSELRSATYKGFPIENTYVVDVQAENDVEQVTAEFAGDSYEAEQVEDGQWQVDVDLGGVDGNQMLEFTAEDAEGNVATERELVLVVELEWLQYIANNLNFRDIATPESFAFYRGLKWDIGPVADDTGTDVLPYSNHAGVEAEVEFGVGFVVPDGLMEINLGGELNKELTRYEVTGGVDGTGTINIDGELESVSGGLYLEVEDTPIEFTVGPPGDGDLVDVSVSYLGSIAAGVEMDYDGSFSITEGTVTPGVGASGSAGGGVDGAEGEVGIEGSLEGPIYFERTSPYITDAALEILIEAYAEWEILFYTANHELELIEHSVRASTFLDGDADASSLALQNPRVVDREQSGWEVGAKYGEQPAPSVTSVDDPTARTQSTAQSTESVSRDRLTARPLRDTEPTVASYDGDSAVLWSSQNENRSVEEGRDIVVRTGSDGAWSDPTAVTDDRYHDEAPAVASTDDGLVATWSRLDAVVPETNISSPSEAAAHQEIALARYDGSEWSSIDLLTDNDVLEHQPVVAAEENRSLVAWERNDANEHTAFGERSVQYALLEDGSVVERGSVDGAARPDVGVDQSGTFELAYYEPLENGSDLGTVVHGTVSADGSFDARGSIETTEFDELSVDAGQVAWINGSALDPSLQIATGDEADALPFATDRYDVSDVTVALDGDDAVVTYRARSEGQDRAVPMYRVARDGEWIDDRRALVDSNDSVVVSQTAAAFDADADALSFAYVGTGPGENATTDVFHSEREFAPAYALEADAPGSTPPGAQTAVEYTVENVGEAPGTGSTTVELRDGSSTVATDDLQSIASGESVDGSFETTAPADGELTVALSGDAVDDLPEPWLDTSVDVRTGLANTSVTAVDTDRVDEDAVRVDVTLDNDGTADATDLPVAIRDGSGVVETFDADRIPANDTATVSVEIDPATVNRTVRDRVVLDPNGTLPAGAVDRGSHATWLLQPAVGVHGPVTYVEEPAGTTANLQVSNHGTSTAETTIAATDTETGSELGRTTLEVPPATESNSTFEPVSVPLNHSEDLAGRSLRFTAETTVPGAEVAEAAIEDTAGPVTPATGTVRAEVVDGETGDAVENATVMVDNQGSSTDASGVVTTTATAGEATIEVAADGYDRAVTTVSVPVDETADERILLPPEGPSVADYVNDDGVVDVDGLLAAIDDFRADAIGVDGLLDVIDAFRSGESVV